MNGRRLHASVRGVDHGVWFRHFVLQTARSLRLTGWVANRYDGSVEILAEGTENQLEILLREVTEGPRSAVVEDVDAQWSAATGEFKGFDVSF